MDTNDAQASQLLHAAHCTASFLPFVLLPQGHLDNIVEFLSPLPLPPLPPPLGTGEKESAALRLTLRHTYHVHGARTVEVGAHDFIIVLYDSREYDLMKCFQYESM